MKEIRLFKPIVLEKSLEDMTKAQHEQAIRLLRNTDYITIGESGIEIQKFSASEKNMPAVFFYGSEAVCIYRQMLGLPDVGIRIIDVDEITESTFGFDTLFDIMHFLSRVSLRNERVNHLADLGVPLVILVNEYRLLREYVEYLQDNNWCGKPHKNIYDVPLHDGGTEHHEDIRKSLADIRYDLTADYSYLPELDKCENGDDE
jgi:hypothetical protein